MRTGGTGGIGRIRLRPAYRFKRVILGTIVAALFSMSVLQPAGADTPISHGYLTDEKLALGSIVSLKENSTDSIEAATNSNVDNLLGVVVSDEISLLAIKSGEADQVQVATSGTLQVLVSDINGPIQRGDHITASSISGVGMKATGNVRVIGIAQGDLNATGVETTYTDDSGQQQSVKLGQIPLLVNVAYYFKEPDKTVIPSALQNLANAVAGRTVNTIPILISLGIFVVMLIVVASIIYSMIRGSIISVGRNPMSQSAVYRNLIQLSALVIIILGIGFAAMYLVITRVG